MKWFAALFFLFLSTTAQAADSIWVQATATGYEARATSATSSCPVLHTEAGDTPMRVRAPATEQFPQVCAAPIAPDTRGASIAGQPLAAPVANPTRILVLGDTGCRIKGAALQACNDPAQWPFPPLATAAAKLKPDLILHLGDYLYRESPCPPGVTGCAGSPWGDNWTTWQADFFTPAAPLLAAAPVVLVRGNHEDCERAGLGWLRLMGPSAFDGGCPPHLPVYTVDVGAARLAVMDDASAPETSINRADLPVYAAEIAALGSLPAPVWFVHHRPIWAAISGPLNIPVGGNRTLIEAAGSTLIPGTVELQLSGHIHSFEAINFDKVPPQIVAGHGGDNLHATPQNLRGAMFQGSSGVSVTEGLSVDGFGFLLMTKSSEGWTIDLYDAEGRQTRQCRFIATANGSPPRVYCPT
jgi:hypothetical protein